MATALEMQIPHGNSLRAELGKALECYERACFFWTLPRKTWFQKLKDGSTILQEEQAPQSPTDPYKEITAIYVEAATMLYERLGGVSVKYFKRRSQLFPISLLIADRDKVAVYQSRTAIWDRFGTLAADTIAREHPRDNIWRNKINDQYALDWLGLNHMCRLYMDEISYLSGRVDTLNNTLIAVGAASFSICIACFNLAVGCENLQLSKKRLLIEKERSSQVASEGRPSETPRPLTTGTTGQSITRPKAAASSATLSPSNSTRR